MKKHYSYLSVCQILVERAFYSCHEEALLILRGCQILVERAYYSCYEEALLILKCLSNTC